jgi:hypothetical protein
VVEVRGVHLLAAFTPRHGELRAMHRLQLAMRTCKGYPRQPGQLRDGATLLLAPQERQQPPPNLRSDEVLQHVPFFYQVS